MIKGKKEPERRVFESRRADTDVEAPGQLRFSSREVQRTAVDGFTHADGSSELGEISFLKPLSG